MKTVIVAASAFLLALAPASAGGYGGHNQVSAPQFAHSSALNYVKQIGVIKAHTNKGKLKQVTGASAESINKASCDCPGKQVAKSFGKNRSFQFGAIKAGHNSGKLDQSSVVTSFSKNVRSVSGR